MGSVPKQSRKIISRGRILAAAVGLLPGLSCAGDLLGFYAGGSIGEAQVQAEPVGLPNVSPHRLVDWAAFKANHSAFKVMLGIRPISMLGAEVEYLNFGQPSGNFGPQNYGRVSTQGVAAFGVLYLPVPVIDVFAKAGIARLQSSVNASLALTDCPIDQPYCPSVPVPDYLLQTSQANSEFAAGVGAQFKFGPWAARAEFERFGAAGANPNLISLGVTWTF